MAYNSYEEYSKDSADTSEVQIDPRDTYGSRFSVKARKVVSAQQARSAISSISNHLRNSDKIFSKRHEKNNLGGSVNMKNVSNSDKTQVIEKKDNLKIEEKNNKKISKSSGLDSLFESTIENDKQDNTAMDAFAAPEDTGKIDMTSKQREERFEKYQAMGQNRGLKVIKPISYNSAMEITSALKAECAVVLYLKGLNDKTAKRLLDFAFGAASMCGAHVALVADKTYALTIGPGLSQREILLCVKEGVAIKLER